MCGGCGSKSWTIIGGEEPNWLIIRCDKCGRVSREKNDTRLASPKRRNPRPFFGEKSRLWDKKKNTAIHQGNSARGPGDPARVRPQNKSGGYGGKLQYHWRGLFGGERDACAGISHPGQAYTAASRGRADGLFAAGAAPLKVK